MNDGPKIRKYRNVEQMKIVGYHITGFQRLAGVLMMNEALVGKYSCEPTASNAKTTLLGHYHNIKLLKKFVLVCN
jgi:hypothetical protein